MYQILCSAHFDHNRLYPFALKILHYYPFHLDHLWFSFVNPILI